MFCSKCGAENPENATICSSCSCELLPQTQQSQAISTPKTSGLAITSLVLGILSGITCMLTALPAIICGIVSLVKITNKKNNQKGIGFAIGGIALPVVMLPIFMMALAISMPALARVKVAAQKAVSMSNLQAVGSALIIYSNDHDGKLPDKEKWCDLLMAKADLSEKCLMYRNNSETLSYAINEYVYFQGGVIEDLPPNTVFIFETPHYGMNFYGGPNLLNLDAHNSDGCNILFVDGHVEFIKADDFRYLQWNVE